MARRELCAGVGFERGPLSCPFSEIALRDLTRPEVGRDVPPRGQSVVRLQRPQCPDVHQD